MGNFLTVFAPEWRKRDFFGKSENVTSVPLLCCNFVQKNQNKPLNGLWDLKRTDGRTYERTEANLKVPTASGGGPKTLILGKFDASSLSNQVTYKKSVYFNNFICPPPEAVGTFKFASVRVCVRPFVHFRSQNPFIGLFWFLVQSCSIISVRKWHFRIFPKYPVFAIPGQKLSKIAHFAPKTDILINFSKSGHMILLFFLIETTFMVYY